MLNQKGQLNRKIKASQLAPLLDRLGRLLVDLAPQVAMMGHLDQSSPVLGNFHNENLSTFTNEGSLESRLAGLGKRESKVMTGGQRASSTVNNGSIVNGNGNGNGNGNEEEVSEVQNGRSQTYCQFQIPVMLTPA